jgi:hypothetical protein
MARRNARSIERKDEYFYVVLEDEWFKTEGE